MGPDNVLPPPPDLVLRLAFAGNRRLPADTGPLDAALDAVLSVIAQELRAVFTDPEEGKREKISRFYARTPPCLRLVTGLAEGADEHAARALDRLAARETPPAAPAPRVRTELAAILPFDPAAYAESRDAQHRVIFDARCQQCAYVLPLDGIYARSAGDPPVDRRRRNRAYRAQAATLLRHADLFVAALDLSAEGKPGGTLETVAAALEFDLPVVLIDTGAGSAVLPVEPEEGLHAFLDHLLTARERSPAVPPPPWEPRLRRWVRRIVADPDYPLTGEGPDTEGQLEARLRGQQSVEEYLAHTRSPPLRLAHGQPAARASLRAWVWEKFERWFRPALAGATQDATLRPFDVYRQRATSLNYLYSGLYRGSFVLNYALAVGAVLLAALSLVLIGLFALRHAPNAGPTHEGGTSPYTVEEIVLIALTLGKLGLLFWIARNTDKSRHGNWSDRAVDYRYLAERLRTMYYLPLVGSFQPPAAVPLKYASRNVRQSGIDWLFGAIVRSVSPAQIVALHGPASEKFAGPTLKVDPAARLTTVRENWIGRAGDPAAADHRPGSGQVFYHHRNGETLRRMHESLDHRVHFINKAVISIVILDLLALLAWMDTTHLWTPWLVFGAAVLPAVVASLNGLRFQSECQRLADRSAVMAELLADRAAQTGKKQHDIAQALADPDGNLGSYNREALGLVEALARDMVEEVSEWSVLYAKEVTDT